MTCSKTWHKVLTILKACKTQLRVLGDKPTMFQSSSSPKLKSIKVTFRKTSTKSSQQSVIISTYSRTIQISWRLCGSNYSNLSMCQIAISTASLDACTTPSTSMLWSRIRQFLQSSRRHLDGTDLPMLAKLCVIISRKSNRSKATKIPSLRLMRTSIDRL